MVCGKRFKTFTSLFCSLWIFGSVFYKCIFLVYFAHAHAYIHVRNFYCQYMLQLKPSKHNILCLSNWRIFSKDWWGLIIFLHLIKVTVVGLDIVLHVFSFSWSITWREGFYWGWLVRWGTLHPLWKEQATCWEGSLGVGQEFARSVNYTMRTFQLSTSSFFNVNLLFVFYGRAHVGWKRLYCDGIASFSRWLNFWEMCHFKHKIVLVRSSSS